MEHESYGRSCNITRTWNLTQDTRILINTNNNETAETTQLLRSENLLRNLPEIWGGLLLLNLQW